MPIQSATNCTNTELQTSEFKQKFQHRPVCKTNLELCLPKLPHCKEGLKLGCWPSKTFSSKLQPTWRLTCQSFNTAGFPAALARLPNYRQARHFQQEFQHCRPWFPYRLGRAARLQLCTPKLQHCKEDAQGRRARNP